MSDERPDGEAFGGAASPPGSWAPPEVHPDADDPTVPSSDVPQAPPVPPVPPAQPPQMPPVPPAPPTQPPQVPPVPPAPPTQPQAPPAPPTFATEPLTPPAGSDAEPVYVPPAPPQVSNEPVAPPVPPPTIANEPVAPFSPPPSTPQAPAAPGQSDPAVPPWNTTGVAPPPPVDAAPPPPPPGAQFGGAPPPPVQPQRKSSAGYRERWNWAAGCVIGLTTLSIVFSLPQLLVRLDEGFWDFIDSSEWTLWASAGAGLLAVLLLASGTMPVVAVAAAVSAGFAITSLIISDFWDEPSGYSFFFSWTIFGAYVLLGLLSAVCLRRVRRA